MALALGPADMGRSLVDGDIGRESACWASFVEAKKAFALVGVSHQLLPR